MSQNRKEAEKHCEHCGKPLFGRTDKRFCNDTCRNTFNRNKILQEQQQANEKIPEIFRIIKRNYEILKAHAPPDSDTQTCFEKGRPADEGINEKFFTSIYKDENETWYFCFEFGWRKFDDGGWAVSCRIEQGRSID